MKTRPRPAPSRKPPPASPNLRRVRKPSGRSTHSPTRGMISVNASRPSRTAPIWILWCSPIPSRPHSHAPARRNAVKVVTSPAAMAYGRRLVPATPAKMIGRTGRMHGVKTVITPAANAIGTRTITLCSPGYAAGVSAGFASGSAAGSAACCACRAGCCCGCWAWLFFRFRRLRRRERPEVSFGWGGVSAGAPGGAVGLGGVLGGRAGDPRERPEPLACRVDQLRRARRVALGRSEQCGSDGERQVEGRVHELGRVLLVPVPARVCECAEQPLRLREL